MILITTCKVHHATLAATQMPLTSPPPEMDATMQSKSGTCVKKEHKINGTHFLKFYGSELLGFMKRVVYYELKVALEDVNISRQTSSFSLSISAAVLSCYGGHQCYLAMVVTVAMLSGKSLEC